MCTWSSVWCVCSSATGTRNTSSCQSNQRSSQHTHTIQMHYTYIHITDQHTKHETQWSEPSFVAAHMTIQQVAIDVAFLSHWCLLHITFSFHWAKDRSQDVRQTLRYVCVCVVTRTVRAVAALRCIRWSTWNREHLEPAIAWTNKMIHICGWAHSKDFFDREDRSESM